MKWRVYKHQLRFIHNVEDNSELIDKTCLKPHEHGFDPNPVCVCEIIVHTEKWLDFKTIKNLAIKNIESMANKTTQPKSSDIPYYDFGTMDTETFTTDLRKLMITDIKVNHMDVEVQIWLDETKKYAMWDDGIGDR